MHRQMVYVTYDLPAESGVARGAKALTVLGYVVRHEIREFRKGQGRSVNGVRLTISSEDADDLVREMIEVPAGARNVELHLDTLPEKYRAALKRAA